MAKATLTINHEAGLHARPASLFVKAAQGFEADIQVSNLTAEKGPVDAKSILKVLTLAANKGSEIKITADGPDADDAVASLVALIEGNFGE